jgi:predicted nucleic acid-binding protein
LKYLDASIPLCVFLGEPEEKLEACRQIIQKTMKRERPARIEEIMKRFFGYAGLRGGDACRDLCLPALELALRYRVDFVDAHHRLAMKLCGIDEIYSLDRHLDSSPGIRRLESV